LSHYNRNRSVLEERVGSPNSPCAQQIAVGSLPHLLILWQFERWQSNCPARHKLNRYCRDEQDGWRDWDKPQVGKREDTAERCDIKSRCKPHYQQGHQHEIANNHSHHI
jgi:hypothetical protein